MATGLIALLDDVAGLAKVTTDHDSLLEAARAALGPAVAARHVTDGTLYAVTLESRLEQSLLESLRPTDIGLQILIDPHQAELLIGDLSRLLETAEQQGTTPVVVVSPQLRTPLRRLTAVAVPRLPILSYAEITKCTFRIETVGVVSGAHSIAA